MRLLDRAQMLEAAAHDLERVADGRAVSLPYQQTIEEGLVAVELMAQDVAKKIKQRKYIDVQPAPTERRTNETKKPTKKSK